MGGDFIQAILDSQAEVVLGRIVLWLLIGAVSGGGIGLALFFGLSRAGAWPKPRWARVLTALWLFAALAFVGGWIGGCEGGYRGVEQSATEGALRTKVLRPAGEACAAALAFVDVSIRNLDLKTGGWSPITPEQEARLREFAAGRVKLDVRALLERLKKLEQRAVDEISAGLKEKLREEGRLPAGSLAEKVADPLLDYLIRRKLREKLPLSALESFPDAPTFSELADHVVVRGAIPAILDPARSLVRSQQLTFAILGLAAVLLPLALAWLARKFSSTARLPKGLAQSSG